MIQPVKYTFDTPFEAARPGRRARTSFDLAELEAAKQSAYADGARDGAAKERAATERREADALAAIAEALRAVAEARADAHAAAVDEGARLAGALARRFAGRLIARDPAFEVEALLRGCLESLHGEPRIVLRVGAEAFDLLGPRIDALAATVGFAGRIVLVGDPSLTGAACRVEWADGGAERDDAETWAAIDALLGPTTTPDPPTAPTPDAAPTAETEPDPTPDAEET